jgi:hypothetical protein
MEMRWRRDGEEMEKRWRRDGEEREKRGERLASKDWTMNRKGMQEMGRKKLARNLNINHNEQHNHIATTPPDRGCPLVCSSSS